MDIEKFVDQEVLGCFVGGENVIPSGRKRLPFVNVTTQKEWKKLVFADREEVQRAIALAEEAFPGWKGLPSPARGGLLRKAGDLLVEHKALFAKVMAMEMGKPVREGETEVDYAAGFFYWFAGEAERIYGKTIPSQFAHKRLIVIQEPIGVCGLITPWNFPLAMPARKVAAALAAGCSIVLKPSPEAPITALVMAYVCCAAGVPPGVFNVVIGPEKEIGEVLLSLPVVRKIAFTGSCEVGKYLYEHSAATLKKLTLELGGHAPLLVFEDADIEKAAKGTVISKFRNNGQTCVCPNRVFVQKTIYEPFLKRLLEYVKALKVGDPLDPETDLSHVLHPASIEKVKAHIEDALSQGATPEYLGEEVYHPKVLGEVTSSMKIFHEETFGPVIALSSFETEEEALRLANGTPYGLASYVFTEDLSRAQRVVEGLEYGIVGLNDPMPSTPQGSFGGVKASGFGREGGPSGIREYLVEKYISVSF